MTTFRLVSLPAHGVLEMSLGMLTLVAPFALGFGDAGMVSAIAIGALIIGLALGATVEDRSFSIAAHFAADRGLAFGLAGAGGLFALTGDPAAAVYFAATGVALLLLSLVTRYTRTH
jgi:hypothetical protein